jgi:hypothetical protein
MRVSRNKLYHPEKNIAQFGIFKNSDYRFNGKMQRFGGLQ